MCTHTKSDGTGDGAELPYISVYDTRITTHIGIVTDGRIHHLRLPVNLRLPTDQRLAVYLGEERDCRIEQVLQ